MVASLVVGYEVGPVLILEPSQHSYSMHLLLLVNSLRWYRLVQLVVPVSPRDRNTPIGDGIGALEMVTLQTRYKQVTADK